MHPTIDVTPGLCVLVGYTPQCPESMTYREVSCAIRSVVNEPDFKVNQITSIVVYGEGLRTTKSRHFNANDNPFVFHPWPNPVAVDCAVDTGACYLQFENGDSALFADQEVDVRAYETLDEIPIPGTFSLIFNFNFIFRF